MTRILLIDEDRNILAALATSLEGATYEVTRALTETSVRQALAEESFDLVLMDVDFGRGLGWTLLDAAVAASMRVVVLSRLHATADVVRGLRAGATDYLAKPYRIEEVLARIAVRLQQPPPLPLLTPGSATTAAPMDVGAKLPPDSAVATPIDASLPLGQRLRAARKARNISLVQANLDTRIQMYYIQALEEEKYSLLPRGAATDTLVQRYAAFLGEDSTAALTEFRRLHHNEVEGPRDLAGQPLVRRRRWPLLLSLLLVAMMTCGLTGGALALIFPNQTSNVVTNVRGLWVAPTVTSVPTPTPLPSATSSPTPTAPPTPTPTATATATLTVVPPTATSPISSTITP